MVKKGEKAKKEAKKPAQVPKRLVRRLKASRKKKDEKPTLSAELLRIQPVLQVFWEVLRGVLLMSSWCWMVILATIKRLAGSSIGLALRFQTAARCGTVRTLPWNVSWPQSSFTCGDKINVRKMKKKSLKSDTEETGIRTQIYQTTLVQQRRKEWN